MSGAAPKPPVPRWLMRVLDATLGRYVDHRRLWVPTVFGPRERLRIAPTAYVWDALFNTVSGTIAVGDGAFFGHGVMVLTGRHDAAVSGVARQTAVPTDGGDIVIGAGAWIASRAVICGPCTIGENATVAAGAVVTRDVAPGATVAGVPAREIAAGHAG